jgi:hypothetical protein
MQGRNQRAPKTMRIALPRRRPGTVAGSREPGRNGTTAPPHSDCPTALGLPRPRRGPQRKAAASARPRAASRPRERPGQERAGDPCAGMTAPLGAGLRSLPASTDSSGYRTTASAMRIAGRRVLAATASHRAAAMRRRRASARPRRGCVRCGKLLLYAEEIDTATAEHLRTPQAFTHLALTGAASLLIASEPEDDRQSGEPAGRDAPAAGAGPPPDSPDVRLP